MDNEDMTISVYWWNFGKKTKDFAGSYKGYLAKRDISVRRINHPIQKDIIGNRFKFALSSSLVTLDIFSNYCECCDRAILVLLTLLGDKALYTNCRGREYKVNW